MLIVLLGTGWPSGSRALCVELEKGGAVGIDDFVHMLRGPENWGLWAV